MSQVRVKPEPPPLVDADEGMGIQWQERLLYWFLLVLLCWSMACFAVADGAEAKNIVCLDGDTLRADLDFGWGLEWRKKEVRIFGFDAWETSYRRQTIRYATDELERGRKAKAELVKLVTSAKRVEVVDSGQSDPYGRLSGWVYVDGKEAGAILRAGGHERKD